MSKPSGAIVAQVNCGLMCVRNQCSVCSIGKVMVSGPYTAIMPSFSFPIRNVFVMALQ